MVVRKTKYGQVQIWDKQTRNTIYLSSNNIGSKKLSIDLDDPEFDGIVLTEPTYYEKSQIAQNNGYLVSIHDFIIEYVVGDNLSDVFDDDNLWYQREIPFSELKKKVQEYLTSEIEENGKYNNSSLLRELELVVLCDLVCIDLLVAYPFKFN